MSSVIVDENYVKELEIDLETANNEIQHCQTEMTAFGGELQRLVQLKSDITKRIYNAKNKTIEHYEELVEFYEKQTSESTETKGSNEEGRECTDSLYRALIRVDGVLAQMDSESDNIGKTEIYKIMSESYSELPLELLDELVDFLLEKDIIKPYNALVCELCNTVVSSFRGTPSQTDLSDFLYEQYMCDKCKNEIDYKTPVDKMIDLSIYYKVDRGDN